MKTDTIERAIYAVISKNDGIKARDIAKQTGTDHTTVNHYLYASPYMRELCFRDNDFLWHGLIRQTRPHRGLGDFSGFYGTVREFLVLSEEAWFALLLEGCTNIGRNLNDTRGLFHSFRDAREVMTGLFCDLSDAGFSKFRDWEIVFELRIKKGRMIRIYADVLVITENKVFSLEFKMKDTIDPEEVLQASKYAPYLEVIFGPDYDVIPALVLTKASDLYTYVPVGKTSGLLPVCSGDMLFNLPDEYLEILKR